MEDDPMEDDPFLLGRAYVQVWTLLVSGVGTCF